MNISTARSGFATRLGGSTKRASNIAAVALPLLNLLGKVIALA